MLKCLSLKLDLGCDGQLLPQEFNPEKVVSGVAHDVSKKKRGRQESSYSVANCF